MKAISPPKKQYLQPSVFWSIRQSFPQWLSIVLSATAIAVPLLIWAIISYAGLTTPVFLPTPTAVIQAGIRMFTEDNLIVDILASCLRVAAGFIVAAAIGVPIGVDLEILLRGLKVDTVVLMGMMTNVCVHYTAVDAHQRDYHFHAIKDCCAGSDWDAHWAALRAMEYLQTGARILHTEFIEALSSLTVEAK